MAGEGTAVVAVGEPDADVGPEGDSQVAAGISMAVCMERLQATSVGSSA